MIWHRAAPGYFTRAAQPPTAERVAWAITRGTSRPWVLYSVDGQGGTSPVSHHWTLLGAKRAARKAEA